MKIRTIEELNNIKCINCGGNGFRVVDKRNNKTICIICGDALQEKAE